MYIQDLGEYRYNGRFPLRGVRAVGWLSSGQPFRTGVSAPQFLDKLEWLSAMRPINQMRGFHRCEFCAEPEITVVVEGAERTLGSAEIWVPGVDHLFAAPDLLFHYVRDHAYDPPESFLDAVERLDLRSWDPPRDYGLELYRRSLAMP